MESWSVPHVTVLPGRGESLRLFDTAQQRLVAVTPANGDAARLYVCGITPYDATHIGHIATYLTFDIVQRVWRDAHISARYVQNVTDVDDPLLERAARDGVNWRELADAETHRFRENMEALNFLPPERYVSVAEEMQSIAEMVAMLLTEGAAYRHDSGDVYFDLSRAKHFGHISRLDRPTMLKISAERGGDNDRLGKKDPLDPLLWRREREGEPSWPASFGDGRPGWHVECAQIAVAELGMNIEVQGGGSDLIFPHHEMTSAHAEVAYECHPFAQAYVHAGMIEFDGEKMSKSRGNLVFASQLLADSAAPDAIRLALLDGHYRSDRPWSDELLQEAGGRLDRWRAAVSRESAAAAHPLLTNVRSSLANDLDTPTALAAIDEWASVTLAGDDSEATAPALVADMVDALLGVSLR